MIYIKHKFSEVTICEFDVKTIREAAEKGKTDLRGANLYGANLDGANLYGANLDGADLYGANLRGANLDGEKISKTPLSINGLRYWCLISDGFMRLGCQRHSHAEWTEFSDEQISEMDDGALEFWKVWKEPLFSICANHSNN